MTEAVQFGVLAFTSLLAIVNPLGAVPMYLALTAGFQPDHRKATARRAIITSLAVMFTFAIIVAAMSVTASTAAKA